MNENKHNDEWREGDETWQLLGKVAPKQASARFADDVVRAVRLLPEADPFWPRILKFSSWSAVTACVVLTASIFMDSPNSGEFGDVSDPNPPQLVRNHAIITGDPKWDRIEDVAEAELLAAAADHLDRFSDQELISMIGF
jgi:hypothetical protein